MPRFLPSLVFSFLLVTFAEAQSIQNAPSPSAEEILDRYVQAVGGRPAVEKVRTRIIKGTSETGPADRVPVEIIAKAPDRWLMALEFPEGVYRFAVNGATGWEQFADEPPRELSAAEAAEARLDFDVHQEIRLRELYPQTSVKGKTKVGSHEAYMVEALPAQGAPVKLYFDVESGLLIRRDTKRSSEDGLVPVETYFEDYRLVDSVRLPFTIQRINPSDSRTLSVTQVQHNAPIDDARFAKPSP